MSVSHEEALLLCEKVIRTEGQFAPFMIYRELGEIQEIRWREIMVPLFLDFLKNMDREEFDNLKKKVYQSFK